ncbi:MAG: hypothetical protein ACP5E6_00830, partial [Acidiphilium sp.]
MKSVRPGSEGASKRRRCLLGALCVGLMATPFGAAGAVAPSDGAGCAVAARAASRQAGLPPGLLDAIGLVETGRTAADGARTAWPYTVDADGVGHWFASVPEAAAFARAALAGGARAVDVGCFQIDLQDHPGAFGALRDAFDPAVNASVAAAFLTRLHRRWGTWRAAIAAYHSATPAYGLPYAAMVAAAWHGGVGTLPADRPVTDR